MNVKRTGPLRKILNGIHRALGRYTPARSDDELPRVVAELVITSQQRSDALVAQALVHHQEWVAMVASYMRIHVALAEAVRMLDWLNGAGSREWTPADLQRLEEIREVVKIGEVPIRRSGTR